MNTGLGATGVNSFLTTLNIPWMNKNTFRSREVEASKGIRAVATNACNEAIKEEVEKVLETRTE